MGRMMNGRRSVRLKGFDYAQSGAYFVTICSKDRKCIFGKIVDEEMRINDKGAIVHAEWLRTTEIRINVITDEFIIMPNHLHGIIMINNGRGVLQYAPTESPFRSPSQTIGAIIRGFKSATTKQINKYTNTPGKPVWQRNYYDRIIRDEDEFTPWDKSNERILLHICSTI